MYRPKYVCYDVMFQISAVLANKEIMDVITPGTHGSTYGGNPLACKIALAAIDVIISEGLIENAFKMGEIFRSELTARLDKEKTLQVRGRGLLNGVVLNPSNFIFFFFFYTKVTCFNNVLRIIVILKIRKY